MARTKHLNIDWLNFKSKRSIKYPILVNTTGYSDYKCPFETYNPVGREDYYLIYIVEGELLLDMANIKRPIGRGTAFIVPPKHMYKYSGNPSTSYLFAHFTGSYAEDFLKECGLDILPTIIENKFSAEIQSKFLSMIDVFLRNDQLSTQKCACMLQEILIDICENSRDNLDNIHLDTSLRHIHSFFTSKISVPYLAGLENLSSSRYITVFKKQMGKPPNEYIIELRLQFAKNMLSGTNMSIKQISEHIGYNDPYFFSRLFKKHIGISPQEYRKNNK